ncbi:vanadium-dependent haloperoxidase [Chitinophagaceae bacterium LB-8]|uniref:Vanadium-dependent haloperoxidase n=1 Tax=Paraflavisolibacter caeni TaxID=2982496 RepID=A0A9X2XTQ9_9BACT|nr:vanadium-dependent haloperoxidase [Paraflavisolibacter caeni]MCU7549064.1 vanadium-dependent haloperoxidase [Paraflavisolibacter caeni]
MKKQNLYSVLLFIILVFIFSVQKQTGSKGKNNKMHSPVSVINGSRSVQTNTYSSEVAFKWIDMQLELMRTSSPFIGGLPPSRPFAYTSIALYEAVVPGMPAYQTLSGQLTDMPAMPETDPGFAYHWPTCANAALAAMNRNFFPNTSNANKATIDALENELNAVYKTEAGEEVFQRSVQFGKAVALLIFDWSKTDGAANANAPYTPPVGPGLWAPTPPALAPAFGPYWGNNRLMVAGSLDGSEPTAPPTYSTDPASDYYQMVKEVYDISQTLTADQTALALFYRDNPGFGDGHYLSILKQILEQEKPKLDITAVVLAKAGIACVDAGIGCWRTKFQHNQQRPIKYIREVLGHPEWNTLFDTPPFPDFPSGHSTIAGSFGEILKGFFGNNYHFTDHTYDYLGMAPRSYNSFDELTKEICDSRVYAGIHYRYSCEKGCEQGRKIGQNIAQKLHFKR